jgi:hypothetical protein
VGAIAATPATASAATSTTPIPSRRFVVRISLPLSSPALPERLGGAWLGQARRL